MIVCFLVIFQNVDDVKAESKIHYIHALLSKVNSVLSELRIASNLLNVSSYTTKRGD